MKLYSKVDEAIKRKGYLKSFVAKEIGVSNTTMSLWSKPKGGEAKTAPNVFVVLKLAKLLDCNVEDLFEIREE